jgi:phage terminase large subunit
MEVTLQATPVFEMNYNADRRYVVNQGGTRSSKTYSILQVLILKALESSIPLTISVVRKTLPALKKSVLKDFIAILESMQLYNPDDYNKTEGTYVLNSSVFEFFSVDNEQKIRGSKRNYLFLNEANELSYEDFFQLQIRTTEQIFTDYNPSDNISWIYDLIEQRADDVSFFKTTYKDNTFLDESIVKEIEKLRDTDEDYYRIYGMGERGGSRELVYNFHVCQRVPDYAQLLGIGVDFGFTNDVTAIVQVYRHEQSVYINELIYQTHLTISDIVSMLKQLDIDRHEMIADWSEPRSVEELRRAGFNIKATTNKSINQGIDVLKRFKIFVTEESTNVINELQRYKWLKDKDGLMLNKPIDAFNHAMDAMRYVALMKLTNPNQGKYNISIVGSSINSRIRI